MRHGYFAAISLLCLRRAWCVTSAKRQFSPAVIASLRVAQACLLLYFGIVEKEISVGCSRRQTLFTSFATIVLPRLLLKPCPNTVSVAGEVCKLRYA